MLTEREQAVKNILLEELDGLSYAEHRHIRDQVDGEFIEKAMVRMKKAQRRWVWFVSVYAVLFLSWVSLSIMGWSTPRRSNVLLLLQNLALLVLCINQMQLGGANYFALQKRRVIYKVLKVFEENRPS